MNLHFELLTRPEEITALAKELRNQPTGGNGTWDGPVVAFDTEFIRESTFFPDLQIIQVSRRDSAWLVDVQAFRRQHREVKDWRAPLQPLLDVFTDPKILKWVHAAQGDQECLFTNLGVVATPIVDTAVAAALCGFGENVGLANLLKSVLDIKLKKGHARTNWGVRPLQPQLAEYALADVTHLIELGERLAEQLRELDRWEWARELSAEFERKENYDERPEAIAEKLLKGGRLDKKASAVLLELMRWRERRVRELNVPRRWVADDGVLMDLARVCPQDMAHLSAFRGLNKGEMKKSGEELIRLIKKALENPERLQLDLSRSRPPNSQESRALDLLRCYVGILADDNRIAAKYLLNTQQLLEVLRLHPADAEDLVKHGLMTHGAAHMVGNKILAFLRGERALCIADAAVNVVNVGAHGHTDAKRS
ncbi:MAG: ribonuclease D [Bacteriovoracia bacterium]